MGLFAWCRRRFSRARQFCTPSDRDYHCHMPHPPWELPGREWRPAATPAPAPAPARPQIPERSSSRQCRAQYTNIPVTTPVQLKCSSSAQRTRVARLGGMYLNPAGEPWVRSPPPKTPLPPRPDTPSTLRPPSNSNLSLAGKQRATLRASPTTSCSVPFCSTQKYRQPTTPGQTASRHSFAQCASPNQERHHV